MNEQHKARKLSVYISNTDKFRHSSLYEMIVYAAKRYEIAGATVIKGIMGFGTSNVVISSKFWEFSEKISVVVEIIDTSEKIEAFKNEILLPWMEKIRTGCLITEEEVDIVLLKTGSKRWQK